MEQRADLHVHTHHSDGSLSPAELVERARSVGLDIVGITDHDNINGIAEALRAGEEQNVEIIPGVELSAHVDGREVHILGYFIDPENPGLVDFLGFLRKERVRRAERMVEKLHALNIHLSMEKILEKAGFASVGRPHIANAIIDEGYTASYPEVFSKYIGYGCPAYVEKVHCSPEETLSMITESGGLSFLAHPGTALPEQTVLQLIKAGLDGIETVHPSHSFETTTHYRGIVHQYYLLESGGSDFHGGRRNDYAALGNVTIPLAVVETMRRRLIVQDK